MTKKSVSPVDLAKRRRIVEILSSFGLILVAVGLVAPFAMLDNSLAISIFKWIFCAGALLFTGARMVNVNAPQDSLRLRRLRRMEMWGGFCFCVAAGFWIYNSIRFEGIVFSLPVMRDTVMFTMAGAIIQVISSWMISARMKKEQSDFNQ